jgi:hypothetical protein
MSKQSLTKSGSTEQKSAILLGTGLAVASLILVPAVAARIGLGSSFTGALRIALMKASSRATHGDDDAASSDGGGFSCH